jgi:septum formation protein
MRRVPIERRRLVLASSSPRRRDALLKLGLTFAVMEPDVDETVAPAVPPHEAAVLLAQRKAEAVGARLAGDELIIAADTLIAYEGEIIGKPRDRDHAVDILTRLGGATHHVLTGVALWDRLTGRRVAAFEATEVQMQPLSEQQIREYVDSGEADGKAGAYAIQETGHRFVRGLNGSLSNVVGLPVEMLRVLLDSFEA